MTDQAGRPLAVVATTSDDSHVWNLVGVQLELEGRGFAVHNLGACTPPQLIAETVRSLTPELLVISSINGHGAISVPAIIQCLEEYQAKRSTTIVVGGLLTTDPAAAVGASAGLIEIGCAAVFIGEDAWTGFDQFLARHGMGEGRRKKSRTSRNPAPRPTP